MTLPKPLGYSEDTDTLQLEELATSADARVRRAIARSPLTPAELLERLSHDSDKSVRQALAGNPNTPAEVLIRLGAQFPDQLLENPALDAMFIENPNLFSMVPEETLAAIAKRETCPPQVLGYLARAGHGKGLLLALIQNGKTPRDAVRYIYETDAILLAERYETPEDKINEVKSQVAHHVAVKGEVSASVARAALWRAVREKVMSADDTPVGDLLPKTVIPRCDVDDITALALLLHGVSAACRTTRLPSTVLEAIACKAEKRILKLVQSCEACPPWILTVSTAGEARSAIEAQREASETLWRAATSSGSKALWFAIADHPLSIGQIEASAILDEWAREGVNNGWQLLAGGHDWRALCFIASNPKTLSTTLEFLYESVQIKDRPPLPSAFSGLQGIELRKALEKWIKSPSRTSENLLSVSGLFFETDRLIQSHPNVPMYFKSNWAVLTEIYEELGANPNTPAYIVRRLAEWGTAGVARNRAAEVDSLRMIFLVNPSAADDLAKNSSSPPELLLELMKSKNQEEVLPSLVENPSSPEELLLLVANHKLWWDLFDFDDTDRKISNHPNVSGRVLDALITKGRIDLDVHGARLARDTRLSEPSYQRLAKIRGGTSVRKQLASNVSVSLELLQRLATDKDESVKKAATRALKVRQERAMQ